MKPVRWLLSVSISIPMWAAFAQAAVDSKDSNYVICRNHNVVRTIRVGKDDDSNKCVTLYTKSGVDQEVGRAQSRSSCVQFLENIRTNLEKASWKCKDVGGNASFTSSVKD